MKTSVLTIGLLLCMSAIADGFQKGSRPSQEDVDAMFFETKMWPATLYCVREKTSYITSEVQNLNHNELYHLDFSEYTWKDSKYKGRIEYLGSTGEFSAAFVFRDEGGYPYRIVEIINQDNGLYLTRANVVGTSVFAYWSKCTENN